MKKATCLALVFVATACTEPESSLAPSPDVFPVIPFPANIEAHQGTFELTPDTRIALVRRPDVQLSEAIERWAAEIRETYAVPLPVVAKTGHAGDIRILWTHSDLEEAEVTAGAGLPGTEAESYRLGVTTDDVLLAAAGRAGVFYGLQTLGQMMQPAPDGGATIPTADIQDGPRFPYRGMLLDVGRHFFSVDEIKQQLDVLAAYKMNVFHWHLTEDQGWRLEIQAYPRLTEVGSCRAETVVEKNTNPYVGDGIEHCGFYTQDEVRDVVEYARRRFITVIPEIEMPAHSRAALAAYPELACTPGPFEVMTRWGGSDDIYCPKPETFAFLEDVLTETLELFPSPYIHIGGDEARKVAWQNSAIAQEVMAREGLTDEDQLQSWFISRMERFLNENGRSIIGWDEILEGGLAPNATVMSWRGMAGGTAAAQAGHDVIMTPTSHAYLDYYQGDAAQEPLAIGGLTTLERVYEFEPVPAGLSPEEEEHILGTQANVWTEYIPTAEHMQYMALPRLMALAEVAWSPAAEREWASFSTRLPRHLADLDARGINYRIPDVSGLEMDRLTLADSVTVTLTAPVDGTIHYTLDGNPPESGSAIYEGPLTFAVDESGVQVAARVVLDDGRSGAYRIARFSRAAPTPAVVGADDGAADSATSGLAVQGWLGRFSSVDGIEGGERFDPTEGEGPSGRLGTVSRIALPSGVPAEYFGLELTGSISVPADGIYTFHLASDEGSVLQIAGEVVVDHDGIHTEWAKAGQIALAAGWHEIRIRHFQRRGGAGLKLEVEGPGVDRQEVPETWLTHRPAA